MDSKFSIIIPCYNSSSTICETLESIEKQCVSEVEVVCVDDGSIDNTYILISEFARKSKLKIVLVNQTNKGVSAARNTGMANSTGDVLFFLDADDKYSSVFIKEVVMSIDKVDVVYGYYSHYEKNLAENITQENVAIIEIMRDFMYNKWRCHTSAFAYKKRIIKENNLYFTDGCKYGEDWEFTTKYLANCKSGIRLNGNIMFYRISDFSAMKKISYEHTDAVFSAERVERYLEKNKNSFTNEFKSYMRDKTIFSIMHSFAIANNKKLFNRLSKEFNLKHSMKKLFKNRNTNVKTRLAAMSYIISPALFFYLVGKI